MINAYVNIKNWLTKVYAIKYLFGIQVIGSVNMINCVKIKTIEVVSAEKKKVDKLVEEYTKKADKEAKEVKRARIILAEDGNKRQCSSYILYIVLFSIIFTINVGTGTHFVYYKYMNCDKKPISWVNILSLKQQIINAIQLKL